jgi:hypothetical protein
MRCSAAVCAIVALAAIGCHRHADVPGGPKPESVVAAIQGPPPTPDARLDEFCGGPRGEPCPSLTEHLAALQLQCKAGNGNPSPTVLRSGGFTVTYVDFGIVGYSRFFDSNGVLVGAIAHVYEYSQTRHYGAVPDLPTAAATPVCEATPRPGPR